MVKPLIVYTQDTDPLNAIHGDEYSYDDTLEEAIKALGIAREYHIKYFPNEKDKTVIYKITVEEIQCPI